ncbi:WxcM-like domain-containing protein [Dysgonomonas sp. GY617]|uniref:WxcM-like domain-containing protein n=1 Tax=Dysgonomonas sp. GY617 TaxID=2780420 RepID=UPI001F5542E0|nr:WxcM-like domain-containing protein [Dysgonomonas sp. GY617]
MASKIKVKEQILDLPKVEDSRGNLSFIEEGGQIPFKIARVYWISDVPAGQKRGSHAFKTQEEIIIALSGSFDVVLNDGKETRTYQLNRAYKALYVPAKMWRTLENFATNSVCLVISSGAYDEVEYIRNFKKFKQFLKIEEGQTEANPLESESIQESKTIVQDNTVLGCSQIQLPAIKSRAGNLTPIHCSLDIPFDVKRVFFVYDIPYGKTRGMHAHRKCHQFLLAASGSFDVELDDGKSKRSISVNRPTQGIHVLPGIWSKEYNYSSGAICLVLASEAYTEEDYIRKYSDFKKMYGN